MAALALSHLEVSVKIIDRRIPGETAGQGDGIQPRMSEMWDALGIGAELREASAQIHRIVIYGPNAQGSGIEEAGQASNVSVDATSRPFETVTASSTIEDILTRALKARGVVIEQPFVPQTLRIVEQEDGAGEAHVEVAVVKLDEEYIQSSGVRQVDRAKLVGTPEAIQESHIIRAKYVLGCDGAHSWVRRAVNISMEGETTDLVWGVIDFTPETDFPSPRAKNVIASPLTGGIAWIPREDNSARVYVRLPTAPDTIAADQTQKSASKDSREKIMQTIEKAFLPYTMRFINITWCNEYKIGQRVARTFSSARRVYLLGDAGRTHSPMAGQGANGAMTDGWNLAWKLAYVLRGHASPCILDTYEEERRAHALQLILFDRAVFELFRPDTFTAEGYLELWRRNTMFLSGLGVKHTSRLTVPDADGVAPGLHVGERAPYAIVTRHSDWQQFSLLELMLYNGRSKLVLLPGDTRNPAIAQRLACFVESLVESVGGKVGKLLDVFTVLNTPKEAPFKLERRMPILCTDENVYADESGRLEARQTGKLYQRLGIRPEEGAAVLVRPDAIMAMVTTIDAENADRIQSYFANLL
ncbi:FAD/NAD-binding domain-containing protein [Fomitopsis schrenkii]|uniref:FAD/NAD-binding domain-containing protein n=1 Tax=Fomitopsis schrenkii TaxID=2126942 RepID=S8F5V5_FOMSC|nr:FAD/NAD-binding domain-containing protein [Fomitopsis schrenkii]